MKLNLESLETREVPAWLNIWVHEVDHDAFQKGISYHAGFAMDTGNTAATGTYQTLTVGQWVNQDFYGERLNLQGGFGRIEILSPENIKNGSKLTIPDPYTNNGYRYWIDANGNTQLYVGYTVWVE